MDDLDALLCARVPPGDARKDVLDVMAKHNITFVVSRMSDDVVSFAKKGESMEDGAKISPPNNSIVGQLRPPVEPALPSFAPNGHKKTQGRGNYQSQNLSSSSSGSSVFGHDQKQTSIFSISKDTSRGGKVIPEADTQQMDFEMDPMDLFAPEPVVKDEFEQSSVKQAPPPSSSPIAPFGKGDEPYDIFQDVKPQVIDVNEPRIVVAEIDLTKDSKEVKNEENSDEEMEEETQEEIDEEEEFSDAGAHLDPADMAYNPKGSASKKKPCRCEVCQKTFYDSRSLKRHQRIHSGVKPFQCDVCEKRFRAKEKLICHARVHTGERPYSCDTCGKSFSQKHNLKNHTLLHTGKEPFFCEVCQKDYANKSSLTKHLRIHSGVKPYQCGVCQKTFRLREGLTTHIRSHTGEKPYECKDCEKKFVYRKSLTLHLRRHHP